MAVPTRIQSRVISDDDQVLWSREAPSGAEGADLEEAADRISAGDWTGLVKRIQQENETGLEDLYRLFERGIRFYLIRQLGLQDVDDRVHNIFLIVVDAIRRGTLREPDRLMGFVRTVARRQIAGHINQRVHFRRDEMHLDCGRRVADARLNPEQDTMFQERVSLMHETLEEISQREREILTRFYLHEETQDAICRDMDLTTTQFRLFKSRAKARFGQLGKQKLRRKMLVSFRDNLPTSTT